MTNKQINLTNHDLLQIEVASKGCISGTLAEWPHLKQALRKLGYSLPDFTLAGELRDICKEILDKQKT